MPAPITVNTIDGKLLTTQYPADGKTIRLDGQVYMIGTDPHILAYVGEDTTSNKPPVRGYVKKSVFDAMNVSSVPIPDNFAGLEAITVPTRLEYQLFRIYEVVENEDYVEVSARHVWYDNLQNFTLWEPTKETEYTGAAACRNILTNAISDVHSHVASDCTDTKLGSEFDYKQKNLTEAFLDPENGLCAKYGLSLIRDNWDFYCLKEVGYDRGFVVEDGKNMLGVERNESLENVATRVAPIGKTAKGDVVWLDYEGKKYIDSQYIADYGYPRVEILDTGLQIGKDGVTAANIQEKLLEAAQKRFTDDKVDLPEVEMTVEFLSLGDTEEYIQYRGLDKVYLYDIITVKDSVRGYSYTAQVVGIEHDILTGMLLSVTIGTLDNWDGTRKIATWQVPEVDGTNIRLKTIQAGAFVEGAINGDDIANGGVRWVHLDAASITQLTTEQLNALTANIHTLIAGSITADDIVAGSITAEEVDTQSLRSAIITAGSITAQDIDAQSIRTAILEAGKITAEDIVASSVRAGILSAGLIQAQDIVASSVRAAIIDAGKITAADIDAASVRAGIISAGKITAQDIDAEAITADAIATNQISAINAKLGTATVTNGMIDNADIGFANIKAATTERLIARDAVTDKYYIDKLAVNNAQMVYATVGELVVKASDNKYYRLDIDQYGALTPTEVTLTAGEIAAGITSDGKASIIETDLDVTDLSASNMKAITALIDQITASRIDVDELWARQAFIGKLNVTDLSSNTYIQATIGNWQSGSTITQTINSISTRISSLGYGTIYYSATEPSHSNLVQGDIWVQPLDDHTWGDYTSTQWQDILDGGSWGSVLGSYKIYTWTGQYFKLMFDSTVNVEMWTAIEQNAEQIALKADQTDMDILSGDITEFRGELDVQSQEITAAVSAVNAKAASYISWTDPTASHTITLGDIWVKTQENFGTWQETKNSTWGELKDSYIWKDALGGEQYIWDGSKWVMTSDRATEIAQSTLIDQHLTYISLLADTTAKLNGDLYELHAELTVANDRISAEVSRATTAEGGKLDKTSQFQTADSIVSTVENWITSNLQSKSWVEQTATGIGLYVQDYSDQHYYGIKSGIEIKAAGVEISGGKYVKIKSGGYFAVDSGNFAIDTSGNVNMTGTVTAASGTIGGWSLGANRLTSGTGTAFVALDSTAGGTYAIWAGSTDPVDAAFWVKRNGQAKFSGTVSAGAGDIGGWSLTANRLYSGSGTSYVGLDSTANGTYAIWAGNSDPASAAFWVKRNGQAKFSGTITAASGSLIGGWTLGINDLHSGASGNYIALASSGTYAMWAGSENSAAAPFRLKPDGTVSLTKLLAIGENGSETEVNLRTANLWKLGYATVKSLTVSGGYCTAITFSNAVSGSTTVNFKSAAQVVLSGAWSGDTFTVSNSVNEQTVSATIAFDHAASYINTALGIGTHKVTINVIDSARNKTPLSMEIDGTYAYNTGSSDGAAAVGFYSESLWLSGDKTLTLTNSKTKTVSIPTATDWDSSYVTNGQMSVSCFVGGKAQSSGLIDDPGYSRGVTDGKNSVGISTVTGGAYYTSIHQGAVTVKLTNGVERTFTVSFTQY